MQTPIPLFGYGWGIEKFPSFYPDTNSNEFVSSPYITKLEKSRHQEERPLDDDDLWRTVQIGEWHLSGKPWYSSTDTHKRPRHSLRCRVGVTGVQGLLRFCGDRRRLNGNCRSNHFGMVSLDVNPSPSEIHVLPIQDRISTHSGIWCVSRTLWGIPLSHIRMKTPWPPKVFGHRLT